MTARLYDGAVVSIGGREFIAIDEPPDEDGHGFRGWECPACETTIRGGDDALAGHDCQPCADLRVPTVLPLDVAPRRPPDGDPCRSGPGRAPDGPQVVDGRVDVVDVATVEGEAVMTTPTPAQLSSGKADADPAVAGAPVKAVLSLCDRSGVMVTPWLEAGFDATIVDVQHDEGIKVEHVGTATLTRIGWDVREYEPAVGAYDVVFAFPPCTNLAASGARWFQEKGLASLIESLQLVEACRRICESLTTCWLLENPHGTLSTYWRKPDYTFDPCDFGGYLEGGGDRYTKRTNLWTGPGFTMPAMRRVEPVEGSKMHFVPPGPERANLRSVTPEGFARAVFEANRTGPGCLDFGETA